MGWSGKINTWAWNKQVDIVRSKQRKEEEDYLKELKKKHNGKGYRISNSLRLSMEITMTDKSVLQWVHEVLGVGTLNKKPRKGKRKDGTKYLMQYRWRCTFRDAYYVCCLIWPWAHTKLPKINQVIDHYGRHMMDGKVISLDEYKKAMSLE